MTITRATANSPLSVCAPVLAAASYSHNSQISMLSSLVMLSSSLMSQLERSLLSQHSANVNVRAYFAGNISIPLCTKCGHMLKTLSGVVLRSELSSFQTHNPQILQFMYIVFSACCTGGCRNGEVCIDPEVCQTPNSWQGQYCKIGETCLRIVFIYNLFFKYKVSLP